MEYLGELTLQAQASLVPEDTGKPKSPFAARSFQLLSFFRCPGYLRQSFCVQSYNAEPFGASRSVEDESKGMGATLSM